MTGSSSLLRPSPAPLVRVSRCSESSRSRSHRRSRRPHPPRRTRAHTRVSRNLTPIRCRARRRQPATAVRSYDACPSTCGGCRYDVQHAGGDGSRRRQARKAPGSAPHNARRQPHRPCDAQPHSRAGARRACLQRGRFVAACIAERSCSRSACSCCSARRSSPGRLGSWRDEAGRPPFSCSLLPLSRSRRGAGRWRDHRRAATAS